MNNVGFHGRMARLVAWGAFVAAAALPGTASANLFAEANGEVVEGVLVAQIVSVDFGTGSRPVRLTLRDSHGGTYVLQDQDPWEGRRDESLRRFAEALLRAFDHNRWVELNTSRGVVNAVRIYASAEEAGVLGLVRVPGKRKAAPPLLEYRFLD